FRKLKRKSPPCKTAQVKLPGAMCEDFAAFSVRFRAENDLPETTTARLLRIYGTRASEVVEMATEDSELRQPFNPATGAIGAEVLFSFQREMAETLTDCLMRRTLIGLDASAGLDAVEVAARIAQKYLGWDERRAAQ